MRSSSNRWGIVLLALTALSSAAQQTTSPSGEANPPGAQPDATTVSDPVMHIGGKVQKPVVLHIAEATFSQEAKQAKFSGIVEVSLIVEKDGTPSHVQVVKGAGHGLDEKAVAAVRQYRFKPATLMGQPVRVALYVSVNFRILE